MKKNESDHNIVEILKELKQKKLRAGYIIDKLRRSLSDTERVKKLVSQVSSVFLHGSRSQPCLLDNVRIIAGPVPFQL